jgi:hypothetical protein
MDEMVKVNGKWERYLDVERELRAVFRSDIVTEILEGARAHGHVRRTVEEMQAQDAANDAAAAALWDKGWRR